MRTAWVGKRGASRAACLIKGELRTGDEKPIANCQILDLSKTGARARVAAGIVIPQMFSLYIPARSETRVCKLVWHSEAEIGLEFINPEQISTYQALMTLEQRMLQFESALKRRPSAFPAPAGTALPASPPQPADPAPLTARLDEVERDLGQTIELVQTQISDTLQHNFAARMAKLETQSQEIHQMLKALLPMLMNKAS